MATTTDLPENANERFSYDTMFEVVNFKEDSLCFSNLFSDACNVTVVYLIRLKDEILIVYVLPAACMNACLCYMYIIILSSD